MLLIPVILSLNQCSIIGTLANPVRKAYQKKKKKKKKDKCHTKSDTDQPRKK